MGGGDHLPILDTCGPVVKENKDGNTMFGMHQYYCVTGLDFDKSTFTTQLQINY